jgi:hypothetical protein
MADPNSASYELSIHICRYVESAKKNKNVSGSNKDKLGEEALVKISRVEFSPVAVHNCT